MSTADCHGRVTNLGRKYRGGVRGEGGGGFPAKEQDPVRGT